jgi:hypothetical protein
VQSIKVDDQTIETEEVSLSKNEAFKSLLISVDSLNNCYTNITTRGNGITTFYVVAADEIGNIAGGRIGGWFGASLGSLLGNPMVAILGYSVGSRLGPIVCGAIASSLMTMALNDCSVVLNNNQDFQSIQAFSNLKTDNIDSIGYYHNLCMYEIFKNPAKYIGKDKSIDVDILYNDIIQFYKSYPFFIEEFENNKALKDSIISISLDICKPGLKSARHELSQEQYVEAQIELLKTKINLSEDEIYLFENYTVKIAEECAFLSINELDDYAIALSDIVKNSEISESLKNEILSSSDQIINSSLCQQQLYVP